MEEETKTKQESYSDWLTKKSDKSKSTVWALILSYIIAGGSLYLSLSSLLGFHTFSIDYLRLGEILANFAIILTTLFLMTRNQYMDEHEVASLSKQLFEKGYLNENEKSSEFKYARSCYSEFGERWKKFLEWLLYFYILMLANWVFENTQAEAAKNVLRIEYSGFKIESSNCLFTIITCLVFNIRSFHLWLCYRVLHDLKNPGAGYESSYEVKNNNFSHDRLLMKIALILFASIQYLFYLKFPGAVREITTTSLIFSGIWGSFTLGMLATHFESRLINVSPFPIALVLIYAAIHPLMFTLLEKSGDFMHIGLLTLFLALILKIHLFLFTHYLYQKRKLMRYFIMMPVISKSVKEILD